MSDQKCEPPPFVLWLWKNGPEDGGAGQEYWAFVDSNPGDANGDAVVLGEPCGYALLKDWPPTPPAEVDALRAERDTLRARVARMEELVHSAYAEGWVDGNNGQYDTAADAWEWASARAALSAETP